MEHIEHQVDDHLFHGRQFLVRQQVLPGADALFPDGLVLRQGVADQPPGADAQEMLHRLGGVIGPQQLLLQGGEGVLPEALMYAAVALQPLVADGRHVVLLILKVLDRVALEVFDPLLADPLVVLFLRFEVEQLVDDLEQPSVLPVDGVHPNAEILPPHELTFHVNSSFDMAGLYFYIGSSWVIPSGADNTDIGGIIPQTFPRVYSKRAVRAG